MSKRLAESIQDGCSEQNGTSPDAMDVKVVKRQKHGSGQFDTGCEVDMLSDEDDCTEAHHKKSVEFDSRKWQCDVCTLLNPVQVEQCIACLGWRGKDAPVIVDKARADTIRASQASTSTSEALAKDDEASGSLHTSLSDDSTEAWTCRRCTLKNTRSVDRCTACEAPNKSPGPVPPPKVPIVKSPRLPLTGAESQVNQTQASVGDQAQTWSCIHCSYQCNPSWTVICDVCNSVRQLYGVHNDPQRAEEKSSTITQASGAKPKTYWVCPKCQLRNQNMVRDCTSCGHLRTPASVPPVSTVNGVISPEERDIWTCRRCTLENPNTAPVCGACQSKRDPLPPDVPSATKPSEASEAKSKQRTSKNSWVCRKCTFINGLEATVCEMCDWKNPFGTSSNTPSKSNSKVGPPSSEGQPLPDSKSADNIQAKPSTSTTAKAPAMGLMTLQRQNTVCMEDVRQKEEEQAVSQWRQIVNFCRVVCSSL